jgi:Ca2+-binding RTX toxin-like protein
MLQTTKTHRPTLNLEALEERANPSVAFVNNNLVITGTDAADTVSVRSETLQGVSGYRVTENGSSRFYFNVMGTTNEIWFNGKGGHDTFTNLTTLRVQAYGGQGNDVLTGGSNDDDLSGGQGNDTLNGGGGADALSAGWWLEPDAASAVNRLNGGEGNDDLFGHNGTDYLFGGNGTDFAYGGGGNDYLYGQGGSDYLYGEAGNDTLFGGVDGKQDDMNGGPGRDTFHVEQYYRADTGLRNRDIIGDPTDPGNVYHFYRGS